MIELISVVGLVLIGLIFGQLNERRHISRIEAEELALSHIQLTTRESLPNIEHSGGVLVTGNVVIALDYFKRFLAGFRMFFGGEMGSYRNILMRARREAILRMKKDADAVGATAIYNVRFEFSTVGSQPQVFGGSEIMVHGTAVKAS